MNLSLSKQHPSSELAKTVKTEKDAERCKFKMTQARPRTSKGDFSADAFEKATLHFLAHYKSKDIYTHSSKKEEKHKPVQTNSEASHRHQAIHRLSPKQAHLFREFQYSAGMIKRESPLDDISTTYSATPASEAPNQDIQDIHLSSVQTALKPQVVRLPSYTIPEHEVEVVEVATDASSKRQSFQSDKSDVSTSSDETLVNSPSNPTVLKRSNAKKEYPDVSTWRTASAIMRAYAKQHPIPSRNDEWTVLPEARRPMAGALRRSSAQRIPHHMKRSSSMKRQTSSQANI